MNCFVWMCRMIPSAHIFVMSEIASSWHCVITLNAKLSGEIQFHYLLCPYVIVECIIYWYNWLLIKPAQLRDFLLSCLCILILLLFIFTRVILKRGEAVSREVMRKVADDKKMSKQEKEERLDVFVNVLLLFLHSVTFQKNINIHIHIF